MLKNPVLVKNMQAAIDAGNPFLRTWRYLGGIAVFLKKGDFNTPPVNPFFKKENGGFDFDISRLLFSNFAQICC